MRWGCGCGSFRADVRVISGFSRLLRAAVGRRETREHSGHYLQALLVQSGERRNAENLSETVPGVSPRDAAVSHRFSLDDEVIIGRLQEYLGTRLEHPEGMWVLDGSDFPKQGRKSVGVARQYCGRLGKVATARRGCSWPMSARWDGHWWTMGCICPRVGPGQRPV